MPPSNVLSADLQALQGTWVPVRGESWFRRDGCWGGSYLVYSEGLCSADKGAWVIEGNRLTWRSQWRITLNTWSQPAQIDIVRNSHVPALHWRGLYRVDGDTLYLSLGCTERPKRLGGGKKDESPWLIDKPPMLGDGEEGSWVIYKGVKR